MDDPRSSQSGGASMGDTDMSEAATEDQDLAFGKFVHLLQYIHTYMRSHTYIYDWIMHKLFAAFVVQTPASYHCYWQPLLQKALVILSDLTPFMQMEFH